jgi:hypothetical protein
MFDQFRRLPACLVTIVSAVTSARYRCTACGNLTRFDVVITRRTSAFHHYTVGGELRVEEERVLDEQVDDVSCRWCGNGASVVRVTAEVAG